MDAFTGPEILLFLAGLILILFASLFLAIRRSNARRGPARSQFAGDSGYTDTPIGSSSGDFFSTGAGADPGPTFGGGESGGGGASSDFGSSDCSSGGGGDSGGGGGDCGGGGGE